MPRQLAILGSFFFLILDFSSFSQSHEASDSLIQVLNNTSHTKRERAVLYRQIAYYSPSPAIGRVYGDSALALSKSIDDDLLTAEILEELSEIERVLGNSLAATEMSIEALGIYDRLGQQKKKAAVHTQMGNVSVLSQDYSQAIEYFDQALIIYRQDSLDINFGLTLLNLGETHRLMGDLELAEKVFGSCLELNESWNNDILQGYALGNLGMTFRSAGKLNEAFTAIEESIKILSPLGDVYSLVTYSSELALVVLALGDTIETEALLVDAFNLARKENLQEQIRDVSIHLSNFYEVSDRPSMALKFSKIQSAYSDSLLNAESIRKIERLRAGHSLNQKQLEIEYLDRINSTQSYLSLSFGIGSLLLLTLSVLLYRQNNLRRIANVSLEAKNEIILAREREKGLLLQELNHRVKNNLQTIASLLNMHSNQLEDDKAVQALDSGRLRVEALSLIHQKLDQDKMQSSIFIDDYIQDLVIGLFFAYGINWKPNIQISRKAINVDLLAPLGLIVNELVCNALKYAFQDTSSPVLDIRIDVLIKDITVDICDNGPGFDPGNTSSEALGLRLVHSLARQLRSHLELVPANGTHWQIIIPLDNE